MKRQVLAAVFALISILFTQPAFSQSVLDIETGRLFSGYNDVRIPGNSGTLFSLSEELTTDPSTYYRLRLFYSLNDRNHLGLLVAPLSITAEGRLDRPLIFQDQTFAAQTPLRATYQFNSYRLMYRYDLHRSERVEFGLGFTAKIRDAKIAVEGNGVSAEKSNVGFVPILHFRLLYNFTPWVGLLLDGDALAAPQGRAEDVLAAFILKPWERIHLKFGYRILEGGADNDKVYNFTLIHYAAAGLLIHF